MDQVKAILKQLQKHHFWLLCVLAMVAALVGWFMARGSLMADYAKNKGTITGKFGALQGILATERHPNNTWTQKMGELTDQQKQLVRTAWKSVYDEQQQHLEWPPELGQDFLDFIKRSPPNAEIHRDLCTRYQDRIVKSEMPRLLAIVDAQDQNSRKAAAPVDHSNPANRGKGAAAKEAPPREYKVLWDDASQSNVEKSLDFPTVPSSAQVRQTQEDIWVYKALLTIIKEMNEGSHDARVRKISDISIGQRAVAPFQAGLASNHIEKLKAAPVDPAANTSASARAEGEAVEKPIDEGRYVDDKGQPLPSGEAAQKQFKRIPIFLRLSIDQREINKLLVICANSPLPVEVKQLRIGAGKQSASSAKAAAPVPMSDSGAVSESESFEVPIELAGIIYLYNPPDMTKLGGSSAIATAGQ